jgi:hypothetical protein
MAQTGFTPISNYYSATATNVPTAGNLVAGELAINTADGKLFYKDSSGVVQTMASKDATAGTYSSITTSNLTIGTTQLGAGNASIMKNRIINGAMVIDQRNAGASVTPSTGTYTLDRWRGYQNVSSKFTIQQSTTAPIGFNNSLLVTSSSAYTASGTDLFLVCQYIEGYNVADLGWGTADAKTVTLSFWVRSSLTGTFGGALLNGAEDRNYPFTYTISSANTWEQKSVTIAGDTTGTWLKTNGLGMEVNFGIGASTTYSGTAGAWAAGAKFTATGATSLVGTSGATLYITACQLEVGASATGFEYVNYQTSLANCQRYYYQINNGASNSAATFAIGNSGGGTNLFNCSNVLPVTMRTIPSISASTASQFNQGIAYVGTASLTSGPTINTGNSSPYIAQYYWGTNSVGSAGQTAYLQSNTATYTYIGFSAEL